MLLILLVSKSTENDESPKLHNIEFLYEELKCNSPTNWLYVSDYSKEQLRTKLLVYMKIWDFAQIVAVIYISSVTNRSAPQMLCATSLKSSIDILSACDDVYVCQKCVTICDHMCLCLNMWHGMVWYGMAWRSMVWCGVSCDAIIPIQRFLPWMASKDRT